MIKKILFGLFILGSIAFGYNRASVNVALKNPKIVVEQNSKWITLNVDNVYASALEKTKSDKEARDFVMEVVTELNDYCIDIGVYLVIIDSNNIIPSYCE